jgi:hypothetical protein
MKLRALIVIVSATLAAACATTPGTPSSTFDGAPSWANGEVPFGCGLGQATMRGNQSLARSAAIDKGRVEIARSFQTQVGAMLKQYADEGLVDGKDYSEEKRTEVSKTITDTSLSGTHVKKTALVGKEFYALVCIDTEAFASTLDKMNTLAPKARAALKARADAAHAELDKELKAGRESQSE